MAGRIITAHLIARHFAAPKMFAAHDPVGFADHSA